MTAALKQSTFRMLAWMTGVLLVGGVSVGRAVASPDVVTVFAAASTTNALTDIAALFEKQHGVQVRLSFAASSALARQIEKGAPADVFISANPEWMDYLIEKEIVAPAQRYDLLGNRLVLIAPQDSALNNLTVDRHLDLAGLLGSSRLATGDPDHVPAGMYGRQALTGLKLWEAVENRLARTNDVRAALTLVERQEAPLGIVYATDAAVSPRVKIVGIFPEESHDAITYPAALIQHQPLAVRFLEFLQSEAAGTVFQKYGFSVR